MPIKTDVLVVGAGPGGYIAAIRLGQLGRSVVLVERDQLGGECLNYGCIPSKAFIHASGLLSRLKRWEPAGLSADGARADLVKLQAWKGQLIGGFRKGIASLEKANNVVFMPGSVKFVSAISATVTTPAGPEKIEFSQAIVATGSTPVPLPGIPFDGMRVMSSKEALDLTEAPKRLIVVGGGVIGLEMGTFFAKLGSRVSVVEFLPQLLTGIEADLVGPVARGLERMGVEIHLESKAVSRGTKAGPEGADLLDIQTPQGPKSLPADKMLVCVGRAPQTAGLGLDALGVKTDPKGHILIDKTLRSSIPSIYAIGDVTGPPYLAHKATREGIVAAEAIADTERAHASEVGIVPWAVFTDPEISFVGETEAQARARNVSVLVGRFPFTASGRAQAVREGEGFIKVLADKGTHQLLGVGIVGPHAADLIGEACLALKMGCRLEDVASTVHPHPTLPEVFPEVCEVALGRPIHVLAPPPR